MFGKKEISPAEMRELNEKSFKELIFGYVVR